MSAETSELVARYAAATDPATPPLPADAARAHAGVSRATGLLGAAEVRDSARRTWRVEARRDARRGRWLVVRPARGDNEPFRASADGFRHDAYLPIAPVEWTLLALLAFGHDGHDGDAGREDDALRAEAFRLVDRMVVDAQHRLLMGAAEDDEDED